MNQSVTNIILIGPMGAGKSAIGREVARQSTLDFFDSDEQVIAHSGVDISWIFEKEGEAGFRKREHQILKALCKKSHCIIATGGGCIMQAENRALLVNNGFVVELKISLQEQLKRIEKNTYKRPMYHNQPQPDTLIQLNQLRGPLYASIADFSVETDTIHSKIVAQTILHAFDQYRQG